MRKPIRKAVRKTLHKKRHKKTSRRRVNFRATVKAKAEFLSNMEIEIAHLLGVVAKIRKQAADMPDKGRIQRSERMRKSMEADEIEERLAERLGHRVLRTYHFVGEYKKLLPKKLRLELYGREGL